VGHSVLNHGETESNMEEDLKTLDGVQDEDVDVEEDLEVKDESEPTEEEDTKAEEAVDPPKQTRKENAKIAEFRRLKDAEIERLKAELEAEKRAKSEKINEVVQTAFKGYTNPYTEKPIETEQDYEDYQRMYREDMLQQLGLSTDFIEKMISENPVVKQAAKIVETQQSQAGKMQFDMKIAEIGKIDPNIKTFDDLAKMPNFEEFNNYVRKPPFGKGYDMVDAFRLVNQTHRKPSQAETKDHLIPIGGQDGGGTEKEIPASELAYWKDSFPNDKPSELRARFNRALKRQGE
jgi:hypothetical protein